MAYHGGLTRWKTLLRVGLEEDQWQWDWTTRASVSPGQILVAQAVAKSRLVWAGAEIAEAVGELGMELGGGDEFKVSRVAKDGSILKKGDVVCEWRGPAALVLALERPFLNLVSYASGIASSTNRLVRQARGARVTATRKILPHYRDLAIYGLEAGGGKSHRVSLASGVLIKENHIRSSGSIAKAIRSARDSAPHGLKIEIEVTSDVELKEALSERADIIMLDNFAPGRVKSALRVVKASGYAPVIEVSGGINEDNIAKYALPGVHVISVGSITHSVKSADISLLVKTK